MNYQIQNSDYHYQYTFELFVFTLSLSGKNQQFNKYHITNMILIMT